ncbi:MarR family transcriptional regulator [Helicobacter sp. MIT 05-5293]|uniref:MarR family winged helix-turn-helix transcriptional regulator n=1 Tax=Helicobacter sp. MIT 05-5293 TaxID=1548149 RepID=UPI0010FD5947|nr:winged helix DNA-binding protein [Helicobacter sp. MIT 05-5293]TLD81605.1 MarR family transcriptional regulator [Helicobacter sp. MIT 05-5293]
MAYQVGRTAQTFKMFFISKLKEHDLNFEQGIILFMVSEESNVSISRITKKLGKDKTTISREVGHLCRKDFLIKKPDINDKRVICLKITDKGKSKIRLIEKSMKIVETIIQSCNPQGELDICLDMLYKIRVALEKASEEDIHPLLVDHSCIL